MFLFIFLIHLFTSVPICFVWLLPKAIENTKQVVLGTREGKSFWGGVGAVVLVIGGMIYANVHAILKVSTDDS